MATWPTPASQWNQTHEVLRRLRPNLFICSLMPRDLWHLSHGLALVRRRSWKGKCETCPSFPHESMMSMMSIAVSYCIWNSFQGSLSLHPLWRLRTRIERNKHQFVRNIYYLTNHQRHRPPLLFPINSMESMALRAACCSRFSVVKQCEQGPYGVL